MPTPADLNAALVCEAAYRRGFQQGMEAALTSVMSCLPPKLKSRMKRWSDSILDWRRTNVRELKVPPCPPLS